MDTQCDNELANANIRIIKVNDKTVLAAGGDIADFQYLKSVMEQKQIDEDCR